jgi:restriction endonuclease S subunit
MGISTTVGYDSEMMKLFWKRSICIIFSLLIWRKIQFKAVATGSVVNNLKSDTVKAVTLSLPPMRIQREIADILSSLDDQNNK